MALLSWVLFASFSWAAYAAYPPATGAVVVLSNDLIGNIGDVTEPYIGRTLNNLTIPDHHIISDAANLSLYHVRSSNFLCLDCVYSSLRPGARVMASMVPFFIEFDMHVVVTTPYFVGSTDATVYITEGFVGALVSASPSRSGRIMFAVEKVKTDLPVHVEFEGGDLGYLLDTVRSELLPYIRGAVKTVLIHAVVDFVYKDVNLFLADSSWRVTLPSSEDPLANVSLLLSGPPTSDNYTAYIPALATVLPLSPSVVMPPRPSTILSPAVTANTSGYMLTAFFDMATVNQYFFASLAAADPYVVTHQQAKRFLNSRIAVLNTSRIGVFARGVSDAFPDRWMEIVMKPNISRGATTPHVTSAPASACADVRSAAGGAERSSGGVGRTFESVLPHSALSNVRRAFADVRRTFGGGRAVRNVHVGDGGAERAGESAAVAADPSGPQGTADAPLCLSITAYSSFIFNVIDPQGPGSPPATAFILGCPYSYALSLHVFVNASGVVLTGQVSEPTCSLEVVVAPYGRVIVSLFDFLFDIFDYYVRPEVNAFLSRGTIFSPHATDGLMKATAAGVSIVGNGTVLALGANLTTLVPASLTAATAGGVHGRTGEPHLLDARRSARRLRRGVRGVNGERSGGTSVGRASLAERERRAAAYSGEEGWEDVSTLGLFNAVE